MIRKPQLFLAHLPKLRMNLHMGKVKTQGENTINYSLKTGSEVYIYRLPNIFGKWCKPNYNSFIATFCYNSINNIELTINDPASEVELMYIDDVIAKFIEHVKESNIKKEDITCYLYINLQ